MAGSGPLEFGTPRLCVEVKSEDGPIDRPTVDKLLGAISKFHADEGLFVSWSGFKSNVQKELAGSVFKVRLWTQKELLEQLFAHYEVLDPDVKAELPLKRVWTVAKEEGGAGLQFSNLFEWGTREQLAARLRERNPYSSTAHRYDGSAFQVIPVALQDLRE